MPHSKRSHEGYLLIDHSASPGTDQVKEGKKFEAPILTCSHCQRGVIVRPDRTRARPYCPKCDHYICDLCEAVRVKAGGACNSIARLIDQVGGVAPQAALETIRRLREDLVR